jgi:1-deoxy-D-xylulose-5-phosphate reductoisomerase
MKNIAILGSTGSIGAQTLDVVRRHRDTMRVCALAAGGNIDLLERQIHEFAPSLAVCGTERAAQELRSRLSGLRAKPFVEHSMPGLLDAASYPEADIVVAALPGGLGLMPTFAAAQSGKHIAIATKEVLVMAGVQFMETASTNHAHVIPVDSEQSAFFQCLQGNRRSQVRRLILTASGGPFRTWSSTETAGVTPQQALQHPRWKMGPKVTIDSATLMNKGLEVIEASRLFGVPGSQITTVIHPESFCHSMVEFLDGSIIAQLGATDMRIPISYALGYPERTESGADFPDFPTLGKLTFEAPDHRRFPLLKAAYDALDQGGAAPIVLNAADEAAVDLFLNERIGFQDIARIVLDALHAWSSETPGETIDDIMAFHEVIMTRVRMERSR